MPAASVLIVDPSPDNREVLRTALSRRGIRTFEAEAADAGLELAREHHPGVIVLDWESERFDAAAIRQQFLAEATSQESSLIVLGRLRRESAFANGQAIEKPYHFAPLIHTIEQLAKAA
jgi:DNA-binding response OmpR family regulator